MLPSVEQAVAAAAEIATCGGACTGQSVSRQQEGKGDSHTMIYDHRQDHEPQECSVLSPIVLFVCLQEPLKW